MSIGGILLGLINIAIVVAILILAGLLVEWVLSAIAGIVIPEMIRRIYLLIVALIAIYLIVALLFGMTVIRFPFSAGVGHRALAALPACAALDHGA